MCASVIRSLPAAGVMTAKSTQTVRTDSHDPAHPSNGKCKLVFFNKLKPHGLWLAKNRVAFSDLPLLLEDAVLFPQPVILLGKA